MKIKFTTTSKWVDAMFSKSKLIFVVFYFSLRKVLRGPEVTKSWKNSLWFRFWKLTTLSNLDVLYEQPFRFPENFRDKTQIAENGKAKAHLKPQLVLQVLWNQIKWCNFSNFKCNHHQHLQMLLFQTGFKISPPGEICQFFSWNPEKHSKLLWF